MDTYLETDVIADMQKAIDLAMTGKRDAVFAQRVQEEGKRIREDVFRKHGLLNVAVPAIRELRDEE